MSGAARAGPLVDTLIMLDPPPSALSASMAPPAPDPGVAVDVLDVLGLLAPQAPPRVVIPPCPDPAEPIVYVRMGCAGGGAAVPAAPADAAPITYQFSDDAFIAFGSADYRVSGSFVAATATTGMTNAAVTLDGTAPGAGSHLPEASPTPSSADSTAVLQVSDSAGDVLDVVFLDLLNVSSDPLTDALFFPAGGASPIAASAVFGAAVQMAPPKVLEPCSVTLLGGGLLAFGAVAWARRQRWA